MDGLNIILSPLMPAPVFAGFLVIAAALFVLCWAKARHLLLWRLVTLALFMLVLSNPQIVQENRNMLPDFALIISDQSASQSLQTRMDKTIAATEYLNEELGSAENLEFKTRIIDSLNETNIMSAIEEEFAEIPPPQRAGIIIISDGNIHDIPAHIKSLPDYGPVHLLLSGSKNEFDRQITLLNTPAYGIVGKTVEIEFRVDIRPQPDITKPVVMSLKSPGAQDKKFSVTPNESITLDLDITAAGQNIFELSFPALGSELTAKNNRAVILVNGVRDRLRVLLVSGQPNAGGRNWRDILTSDPAVDLIHFTILRDPLKMDATPSHELSLIPFPFQELFEEKLYDFDLVILDQYKLGRILPPHYFSNIVRYVEGGGALLEVSSDSFTGQNSIAQTMLRNILPGLPAGDAIKKPFTPSLTPLGKAHPVTAELDESNFAPWMKQIPVTIQNGDILMNGADGLPLLILNRIKEGRVAQLTSDQLWLWSRGYQGGGPATELARRVIHWLMKEPELDENALQLSYDGDNIITRMRQSPGQDMDIILIRPDASIETLTLAPEDDVWLSASVKARGDGIYSVRSASGEKKAILIGDLMPPEWQSLFTAQNILKPLLDQSSGGALWLEDTPEPDIRRKSVGRMAGADWIALRSNNAYDVTNLSQSALLDHWLKALIMLSALLLLWWREGKS